MRISDWSSDVCSSDLGNIPALNARKLFWKQLSLLGTTMGSPSDFAAMLAFVNQHRAVPVVHATYPLEEAEAALLQHIGIATCRARVCQYESLSVVAGS